MKKTLLSLILPMIMIGIGFLSQSMTNQNPLDKINSVYQAYKTIEADFSLKYFRNDQDQFGQTEQGKLLLDQSAGKYRISTTDQELISDGNTQWAVLKDADEVQITNVSDQEEGAISPTNVFSFFQKGYTYKQLASEQLGNKKLLVLELIPEDKRQNYNKIQLRVDQANNHIHDVTIFDKNKSRYVYRISNLKTNQSIENSQFVFNKAKYPNMEIVDLR